MISGNVLLTRDDKLLVLANNKYFIVKGDAERGDDIQFNQDEALPMPSYLFAIAAMEEENLDETLDFIKSKWFREKK